MNAKTLINQLVDSRSPGEERRGPAKKVSDFTYNEKTKLVKEWGRTGAEVASYGPFGSREEAEKFVKDEVAGLHGLS
jgi:hypothetical protein